MLTNNRTALRLVDALENIGEHITVYSDPINAELLASLQPKYVISYNYMHMIRKDAILYMRGRMCNIHISLLPWNRGADPNFWSFIDNTPKGVSIHLVDEGLDTGMLLAQREMQLDEEEETFRSSYEALQSEAIVLFMENYKAIFNGSITPKSQQADGSMHKHKDYLKYIEGREFSYDMRIADFKHECMNQ